MASTPRDYYDILGLPTTASKDEIKKRYRELALKYHPDRNQEPGAEARFKEVSEAYAVLSDDAKREAYDRFGHAGIDQRWATPEDLYRGVDFEEIFGGMGGGMGLGDLFAQMFGGHARRKGRDVEARVRLTLEEVATGVQRRVEVARRVACKGCRGSGAAPGTGRKACASCRGTGQERVARSGGLFQFVQVMPCRACGGEGARLEKPCPTCKGQGAVPGTVPVDLDIPPGVEHSAVVRLRGAGEPAPAGSGAPPGDLFVVLEVEPHPRFERRGLDLVTVGMVPFAVAALGGSLEVELLGGKAEKVQVPAGTQGGTVLTLDRLGLRDARGRRGDLHVLLQVAVPTRLSAKAQDLVRQLGEELDGAAPKPALRDLLGGVLGKLGGAPGRRDEEP